MNGKLKSKMIDTKMTDKIYKIYFYTNFSTSAPKDDPQL